MNCLVVSYGSIGKRHAAILHQLGCEVNLVTTQEIYEFVCYQNIKEALHKKDFDYVVIANPTHLHFSSIVELISCEFTGIVLVEKPLFANLKQLPTHQFKQLVVGYNLRFHALLSRTKQLIENETLVTFTAYVGQYLPTWRKNSDYRECYSAKKEYGGGVLRDLSHELDYSLWFCGSSYHVTANGGHFSELEINSDDVYSIMMSCEACPIVNLHLNYLDRQTRRDILINTQTKTIFIDLIKGTLSINGKVAIQVAEATAKSYMYQHQAVLENQFDTFCSYAEGIERMKLITAAEKAANQKIWISL